MCFLVDTDRHQFPFHTQNIRRLINWIIYKTETIHVPKSFHLYFIFYCWITECGRMSDIHAHKCGELVKLWYSRLDKKSDFLRVEPCGEIVHRDLSRML